MLIGSALLHELCCFSFSTSLQVIKALKYDTRGKVPETYEHDFRRADYAFRYQLVFDPRSQQQVRLNSLPPDTDAALMDFAGVYPL